MRPNSAAAQRNPPRKLNAAHGANETAASRALRRVDLSLMAARVDLASDIGMTISNDMDTEQSGDDLVPAVNALYLRSIAADDYGSDDDLGDSEEAQATKLRFALLDRMKAVDKELQEEWLEADRQDYETNAMVLDHDLVTKRLDTLAAFARHLRKVGRNRASLLKRLAEPLAEEHWLLDPGSHQPMVDTMRGMCELVNNLPNIAAAANHCLKAELPEESHASEINAAMQAEPRSSVRTRQLAQMEKLVHEVEQTTEWLQLNSLSLDTMPGISSSNRDQSPPINASDSRIFWSVLYATPAIWSLLAIVAFFSLRFQWLLIVIIAVLLSLANLIGYQRCDKDQKKRWSQLTGHATSAGFMSGMVSGLMNNAIAGGVVGRLFNRG
ncbi:Golgi apparatus membrane protein tvp23 [Coemansia sp. RSA 2673]|nr:Golgi apparatus membrane protein tvp23 [Coemansia sp. RSA 2673]